jgi:hypothetical protein
VIATALQMHLGKMPHARWHGRYYKSIPPMGDFDELAAMGDRLVLVHGSRCHPETKMVIAPKGMLWAGWVVGVFE